MTRRHITLLCVAALALAWAWLPEFTVTVFSTSASIRWSRPAS